MPKNEIDPEDPLELCGVALLTEEDTSEFMTECVIEEFMRLGHTPVQILGLFRNRQYTGPNMVLQNRGEAFVTAKIHEVFGWWGRTVSLPPVPSSPAASPPAAAETPAVSPAPAPQEFELDPERVDPGGAAIPRLHL